MRTVDARAIRGSRSSQFTELPPADLAEVIADIRPTLARIRRGEWRVSVEGPSNARESDSAALFQARLLELADLV